MAGTPNPAASTSLVRLTYTSVRAPDVTDDDIVELAIDANRNNRGLDITGCLWFGAHRFFQVLEGSRDVIDALYEKIEIDPRHTDLRLLSYRDLAARQFGRWNLAHVKSNEDETLSKLIAEYADVPESVPEPAHPEPSAIRHILDRLATLMGGRPHAHG